MRYFITYLIYVAVVARAIGWTQDSPPFPGTIWVLLAVYGAVLLSEPWVTRRWPAYPRLFLLIQASLVISMTYTAPILDFLAMLFTALSFQAVQFFGLRAGFAAIGGFSLALAGMLFAGLKWDPGIFMLLTTSANDILMGSLAYLINRTERARQGNQRMFNELQSAYRSLKDYASQAEALAAAEERYRMVRGLHDSLTQTLFSMNLAVQAARLAQNSDPKQVDGHLRRLLALSKNAAGEVQALTDNQPVLAGQAQSVFVQQQGLAGALSSLAAERQAQDCLQVIFEVTGERQLPEAVVANLYHIAQEALNNITKHAGTRQAIIRLNLISRAASLEVEDKGCGFDVQNIDRSTRFGLDAMAGRAQEIGWELEIDSSPGKGTRICVREKIL